MGKSTVKALINGLTAPVLLEAGPKTKSMALELILGPMVVSLKDIGKITICMGKGSTPGQTVEVMMESMSTIKKRVKVSTHGLMAVNIMDSG